MIFQQKLCRLEGNGRVYLNYWKGKIYNQDYSTQQARISSKLDGEIKKFTHKQKLTYKRISIRLTTDLSTETLQARREWQDILKVRKGENLQPRLLYPARIAFRFEGEIKCFTDKQKLREFSTTKLALQQMLKKLLYSGNTKRKGLQN